MMSLKEETDSELVRRAGNASQGGMLGPDGPQAELIRRLKESVERLDQTSARQQEKMLRLTVWIVGLTWVMAIVGVIQVVQIIVSLSGKKS